ncbi:MAG: FliM/FliN family flagellar motor switch protein [Myxococcota bacterium]|nr:FliM/FliN family flagellar motor switch protein [Myxococcota bacterium]
MDSVRAYQFHNLPKYNRLEAGLLETSSVFLSNNLFGPSLLQAIQSKLGELVRTSVQLTNSPPTLLKGTEVSQLLPEQGCFMHLQCNPTTERILVDIDAGLALGWIDAMFGAQVKITPVQRPLNEIERGAFSYIILNVLAEIHSGWSHGPQLSLSLMETFSSRKNAMTTLDLNGNHFHLGITIAFAKSLGYIRLFVPTSLMSELATWALLDQVSHDSLSFRRKRAAMLHDLDCKARCEIARIGLSIEELKNLERGDIIIPEDHGISLGPNGPSGDLQIRLGRGQNGYLQTQLIPDSGQLKCAIQSIIIHEQPNEVPMDEDQILNETNGEMVENPAHNDNLEQTEGLLNDIQSPVVVELGRLNLNAGQVIRLKEGQILRLPRAATDPVDLVVNGRVFARGQLVEVEGELGVRILQLAGSQS